MTGLTALFCAASDLAAQLPHPTQLLSRSPCLQAGVVGVPTAICSMVGVTGLLMVAGQQQADKLVQAHDAYIAPWLSDLLGLFYVPAVAIMPALLKGMQGGCFLQQLGLT